MNVLWILFVFFSIAQYHQTQSFGFQRSILDSGDTLMFRIRSFCDVFQDLSVWQRDICHDENALIGSVAESVKMAHKECQHQFKNERWNCSMKEKSSLLKRIEKYATKEAAFTYAIVSAAIIHGMARDCMKGGLKSCHCGRPKRPKDLAPEHSWGGCSDNIGFGLEFSKRFLDNPAAKNMNEDVDLEQGGKMLMDLHNNEAGRQAILKFRVLVCKCHGVTGTCQSQTCWYQVNTFEKVGNYLKQKYEKAINVKLVRRRKTKKIALKFKSGPNKSIARKAELVYIDGSPNFCHKNSHNYVMGTVGRECDTASSAKTGRCEKLCCSRRYKSERRIISEKCHCNFEWCCTVRCKICKRVANTNVCL